MATLSKGAVQSSDASPSLHEEEIEKDTTEKDEKVPKKHSQLVQDNDKPISPVQGVSLRHINVSEGKKGWEKAAARIKDLTNVTQAVGKVKLENKIGTSAADLHDADPLKTISLATQRALKSFASFEGMGESTEDLRSVEFDEEAQVGAGEGESGKGTDDARAVGATGSTFSAHQPAFECFEIFHDTFKDIRKALGITETQFYAVLGLQDMQSISSFAVIGSGDASGKSPSFFFLSPDQRFILKSCTKRDVKTLSRILPSYRDHIKSCVTDDGNGNSSLLPRYIGLYRLLFKDHTPDVTLVVMTNFFAGNYGGFDYVHKYCSMWRSSNI
mmetsp:Transcript_38065/g.77461  ORF Transcript_38065/g.77461 Transcript_38065/m.77461 type:complete len:329 (+) Transcript_38065:167-1153(+)